MKIVSINKHVFIWQSVQEDTPLSIFEMLTKSQGSKNTSVWQCDYSSGQCASVLWQLADDTKAIYIFMASEILNSA